jgi:uncharacterized protein (TIGR00725 family)
MTPRPLVVTIFGSSAPRDGEEEYTLARSSGRLVAEAGCVVCNGGYRGTMEASARGAAEAGGHTIGVLTDAFGDRSPNPWIREVVRTPTLLERLRGLLERGDGYLVLEGGTGTLLELAAAWEFVNKGLMPRKPIVTLGSMWPGIVLPVARQLRREGREAASSLVRHAATPEDCVALLVECLRPGGTR